MYNNNFVGKQKFIKAFFSISLLQEVPTYTNISNGTGILASRHKVIKSTRLSGATEREVVEKMDLGFKYKTK